MSVPTSHPRHTSLKTRDLIVNGVKKGITSIHGLIAHGRGEAFDYLIKEKTSSSAKNAVKAAAAALILAKHPIISVNGNTAALVPKETITLSKLIPAKIEINIFHSSKQREKKIKNYLTKHGAKQILLPKKPLIKHIDHNRRFCAPQGIYKADVVFVPLEDGDRCEALRKMGKKVITIDLNPLSRTAKKANITIIDNITRTLPLLINQLKTLKKYNKKQLKQILKNYNNKRALKQAINTI